MSAVEVVWYLLALTAVAGAAVAVGAREALRVVLGLGAFLLALAGFFLVYAMPFLAVAQLFVYVGGVLVLMLFAIMLVGRRDGSPVMTSRHDAAAIVVSAGTSALLFSSVADVLPRGIALAGRAQAPVGKALLGPLLPHFEVAGILLLAALVAAVAVAGGERS